MIAQIAQINQLFQLLNFIIAWGDALYGLTFMLMSKNENNDVSKDSPIVLSTEMAVLSRDYNQELHCKF